MKKWTYPDIAHQLDRRQIPPPIICLCGSTRFKDEFVRLNAELSLKGYVVLSVGFFHHQDQRIVSEEEKRKLDMLHKRKIDICDEVFVINVGGYIGESTRSEISYALGIERPVRFLENSDGSCV